MNKMFDLLTFYLFFVWNKMFKRNVFLHSRDLQKENINIDIIEILWHFKIQRNNQSQLKDHS